MPAMPSPSPSPRPPRRFGAAAWLAVPLLAGLLGGCAPNEEEFPPVCPSLALVPDAGDLTSFAGTGQDVAALILRARITDIPAKCQKAKANTISATLNVNADVQRGPAAGANMPPIPYFIALMQGDKVLREQDFTFAPSFAANVNRATLHGDDIELLLPISKTKAADVYRIYVGFRLSPDQLAYNRAHPPR